MFRIVLARAVWLLSVAVAISSLHSTLKAVEPSASTAETATHLQVLTDRAAKIVDAIKLEDSERALRVRDVIAQQYLAIGKLHDAGQPAPAELDALHRRFVARLTAQLPSEQVDQVKDGMTYGVVPVTLNGYQQMLPQLTDEQRREIHAQLLEAREYAMDAGSSDAKHAVFGKYKGRINNYLSKAGYDLKHAEKEWAARRQAIKK
jgi:hypothetical protein